MKGEMKTFIIKGNSEVLIKGSVPTEKIRKRLLERRQRVKVIKKRSQRLHVSHTVDVLTSNDVSVVDPIVSPLNECSGKMNYATVVLGRYRMTFP